jgi:hypothetical protein
VPVAIFVRLVTSIIFAMAERQEEIYEEEEPLMFDSPADDFRDLDIQESAANPNYGELGDLPDQRVARNSRISGALMVTLILSVYFRISFRIGLLGNMRMNSEFKHVPGCAGEVPLRTQRSRELLNAQILCHEAGISGPVDWNQAAVMAARAGDRGEIFLL